MALLRLGLPGRSLDFRSYDPCVPQAQVSLKAANRRGVRIGVGIRLASLDLGKFGVRLRDLAIELGSRLKRFRQAAVRLRGFVCPPAQLVVVGCHVGIM